MPGEISCPCLLPERIHNSAQFASGYVLYRIGKQETYPWATPKENNNGYFFLREKKVMSYSLAHEYFHDG